MSSSLPPPPPPQDENAYAGYPHFSAPLLPSWGKRLIEWTIASIVICGCGYFLVRPSVCDLGGSRSTISRVKSDHRSLATAIEAYYVDHGAYPAYSTDPTLSAFALNYKGKKSKNQPWTAPTFRLRGMTDLETITTPVAYITSYFSDPFMDERGRGFCYYSRHYEDGKAGWILFSPGPDGDIDMTETDYDPRIPQPSAQLIALRTYDSTNGTVSDGDVWRVRQ